MTGVEAGCLKVGLMTNKTEQYALDYLKRGWSVIPVRPREKRPAIRWLEYQSRLASEDEIKTWYQHRQDANVAIVTGAVSGLVVVDIDPRHGGEESLAELVRQHGPLPDTIEVLTGGGGRHVYFRHPGGTLRNRVGFVPGIDLRGDGGCVVAPPSVHPSGKRYTWVKGHDPRHAKLAPMPEWLLAKASDTKK